MLWVHVCYQLDARMYWLLDARMYWKLDARTALKTIRIHPLADKAAEVS
jgi:hypothetical protein